MRVTAPIGSSGWVSTLTNAPVAAIAAGAVIPALSNPLGINASSSASVIAVAGGVLLVLGLLGFRSWRRQPVNDNPLAARSKMDSNQDQYRAFFEHSSEAIWRYDLEQPVAVALPEDQQIAHFYKYAYLAECNEAMARMYGFDSARNMVGIRLDDILPRDNPRNIEFLRQFIRSGYRLFNAPSFDIDRDGNVVHALNSMTGVIENGRGIRVWGANRDITEQVRREMDAHSREQQQSALAELCKLAVVSTDVQLVLERATHLAHQTLDVKFAAVLEYVAEFDRWDLKAKSGVQSEAPRDIPDHSPEWLSLGALEWRAGRDVRQPIVMRNVAADRSAETPDDSIVAAMAAVISGANGPFGVLGAYHTRPREFSPDQIQFLQAMADAIGAVILRQAADRALRRTEAQHREIVSQVKDYAIFMIDPDGRASSWNEGVRLVLGYDEAEFVGRPIHRLYPPEDLANDVPAQELAEASDLGSASNDRWMIRKGGRRFWASGITTAIRDDHGRLVGYAKVMRDLTERRRAEMRLQHSRRSAAAAQHIARIGNWELDLRNLNDMTSNRLRWSKEVFRIFGYEPGEVEPSNELFFKSVPPDEHEMITSAVQTALHGRGAYSIVHRIVLPDGSQKVVHEQAEIAYDRDGRPRRMIGTVQDITEQKRAEAELDQHRNHLEQLVAQRSSELEESNRRLRLNERMVALGTLSTGLGHDMGNLLLPIRARLDLMEHQPEGRSVREDIQIIRTATDYLQRLSNGLRLLAAEVEHPEAINETTDLHVWWDDALPILKNILKRDVSLTWEFPADLPLVRMPRHQLTQAVFNLVQNAGDALRGAAAHANVRVWATASSENAEAPWVRVGVTDNGPGMGAEVKRRCLEPFFTTKTRAISTGLGLALVHGIVQRAGGEIEIQSEPGRGTTFVLILPGASPASGRNSSSVCRRKAKVTLSDPRLRSYVTTLLNSWSYEVTEDSEESPDEVLWIAEASNEAAREAVRFVDDDGERRALLIGKPPEGLSHERILQLNSEVKPSSIRQALRTIATAQTSPEARNHT